MAGSSAKVLNKVKKNMNFCTRTMQLKFPQEFRIEEPELPVDQVGALIEEIERMLFEIAEAGSREQKASLDDDGEQFKLSLADACTWLWRTRIRLDRLNQENPALEPDRVTKALESVSDALNKGGVEIQDYTGDFIIGKPGYSILAIEPSSEVTREQVIQTVKPTVYFRKEVIQKGEVVVGKPDQ